MLGRSHRFSFKRGAPKRIYQTPLFVIRYEQNDDKLHCAVVVGKKVDKRAVVRNRIKRKFNETLRELLSLELKYDLVFFVKKQILESEAENTKNMLTKALKEINI